MPIPAAPLHAPAPPARDPIRRVLAALALTTTAQQVAGTARGAVEHALIPALHISKVTAAAMALDSFPLTVSLELIT